MLAAKKCRRTKHNKIDFEGVNSRFGCHTGQPNIYLMKWFDYYSTPSQARISSLREAIVWLSELSLLMVQIKLD